MAITLFDPLDTLVRLDAEARKASPLPRSPEAWREINRSQGERVIGMFAPVDPQDFGVERRDELADHVRQIIRSGQPEHLQSDYSE